MSLDEEKDCRKCVFFRLHDTHEYFGVCSDKNELKIKTQSMSVCDKYDEVDLEDLKRVLLRRGWLRCLSCNKAIFTVDELSEHVGDELGGDLYSDVVASEEAPPAS